MLVIPDYGAHVLTIDLTAANPVTFLSATIQNFRRQGFETVMIRTPNGSFEIPMTDLLAMLENAVTITFHFHDGVLDLYIDYQLVKTLRDFEWKAA